MDVEVDVFHDLFQARDVIGVDAVRLHGVVDAALDDLGRLHAHGLVGVGGRRHRLGGAVQRGDVQEDVRVILAQPVLDRLGIGFGKLLESNQLGVLELLHHDAGVVDDGDALGIALGLEHHEEHHGIDAGDEDRNAEGGEQEGLLLDLVQVFPLDDDA